MVFNFRLAKAIIDAFRIERSFFLSHRSSIRLDLTSRSQPEMRDQILTGHSAFDIFKNSRGKAAIIFKQLGAIFDFYAGLLADSVAEVT